MFTYIITYLVFIIKYQHQFILSLLHSLNLFTENLKSPQLTTPDKFDSHYMTVDDLPIIKTIEKQDFKQLLQQYQDEHGKVLKPVQRRSKAAHVDSAITCPSCQAPSIYLYKNNGNKGQYLCKVCQQRFNQKSRFSKDVQLCCPHCRKQLEAIKDRKNFTIYKCRDYACPYYKKRVKELTPEERRQFKRHPFKFKMHYIFRDFKLTLADLESTPQLPTIVNLSRIHSSPRVLGLILTYYVNYGLSAEKTAAIMYDVHEVKISGQTVRNYGRSVAALVQPFTDQYPYELSGQFCGDETYIRVKGKWHYLFFFFDAVNKVILSHRVSPIRDTDAAIFAIWDVIKRLNPFPDNLKLIVDGNPIYETAQQYFAYHGMPFNLKVVVGLTNDDDVSTEYRPLKQIIERLNRTFKGNYRPLTGYGSQAGSIAHVELFTAYFNFLRPHSSLEKGRVPVQIPELMTCQNMPQKWIRLLTLAENHIIDCHKKAREHQAFGNVSPQAIQ